MGLISLNLVSPQSCEYTDTLVLLWAIREGVEDQRGVPLLFCFLKDFIYLFMRGKREAETQAEGHRQGLHEGSPMRDLIPRLRDHALS